MADKMMSELTFFQDSLTGKKYKPNLNFEFTVAVPTCEQAEYALLIEHDGLRNDANTKAMLRLANEGKAPYCISIGIKPGNLLMPDGTQRGMRMNSYDLFDKEYGDFIVYELIPYVLEKYSFKISDSPDMHIVSGGSSGGISAFCIAWFHPDYFRKVYMSSPSFLGMGRGNEIPYLIRKYETKPLRIYEEYSENEPNDYFGASFPIDLEALRALSFANYDFAYKYFAGEGHCSRYNDEDEAYIRMEWLCRERAHHGNSPRVDQVIPPFSKWEVCSGMPKNESRMDVKNAPYSVAVRSNDEMAVYVASANEDIVVKYLLLGGVPVLALPFEGFTQIGMDIRRISGREDALVLGCAEELLGYLPTRDDISRGTYAALESTFLYKRLPVVPGEAERLGEETGFALERILT